MSALSPVLRDAEDGKLMFWCPGCDMAHGISHGAGPGPRWTWDGNVDKPTFEPSILVRYYRMNDEGIAMYQRGESPPGGRYPGDDHICHSFVRQGRIQFLGDCTHTMANQTVDLPPWDEQD